MSSRAADPALRQSLLEAAARTLAEQGSTGLSLRRLAADAGTSTMAIYTHFGGMDEVRRAVQQESYSRLVERLDQVPETDDALADLIHLGLAYFDYARTEPNLFRAVHLERGVDAGSGADAGPSHGPRLRLVEGVRRCIDQGCFPPDGADAETIAVPLWALVHGVATLLLVGSLAEEEALLAFAFGGATLLRGLGVDPDALEVSISTARVRVPTVYDLL